MIKNVIVILFSTILVTALLNVASIFTEAQFSNVDGGAAVFASDNSPQAQACRGAGGTWDGGECVGADGESADLEDIIVNIANILLGIIGVVAVLMLIIGGVRYVASAGDSKAIEGAKNTILYAIIGIVVAFLSWAAVSFVTDQLGGGEESSQIEEHIVST